MAIKQRFSKPRRLRYHSLFGSVTNLPLGLRDGERAYGVAEYERDLADMQRRFPRLTDGQAKGRVLATVDYDSVVADPHLRMVSFPLSAIDGMVLPSAKDATYAYDERLDRVAVGWTYDRFEGYGRGDCFGAWSITKPGYVARGIPGLHQQHFPDGGIRTSYTQMHPTRLIGINMFEDHVYLGEVNSTQGETAAVHRVLDALKLIVRDYEKRFDVRIKWYGRR